MKYDEELLPFEVGFDISHPEVAFDEQTDTKLLEWIQTVTTGWPQAAQELAATLSDNPGRISRAFRGMLAGYSAKPEEILKITMETPHDGYHGLGGHCLRAGDLHYRHRQNATPGELPGQAFPVAGASGQANS